jgi:hypothetical protein
VTKMRWERENCHAVFLTAIECNNWQIRIMTLQRRITGRSLEGFTWGKNVSQTSRAPTTSVGALFQPTL